MTSIPLFTVGMISFALGVGCFALFGGDPPIPPNLGLKPNHPIMQAGAGSSISGVSDLTSFLSFFTGSLSSESELAYKLGNTGIREPGNRPWDKPLADLREKLGIDFCDKKPDSTEDVASNPLQQRTGERKTGTSYGDPHLITFDGFRYSFQTVGEFTLVKSTDGGFEVQTRQAAVPGRDLSMNTGVAIRSGRDRIAVYSKFFPDSDTSTPLRVNGRPTVIQGRSLSLPSGATIYQQGEHDYLIEVPTGEQVAVKSVRMGSAEYMNVTPSVFTSPPGLYTGLLGNLDGNPENDLRSRNGRVMPSRSTYGEIKNIVTQILPIPGVVPLGLVEDTVFDQIYKDFGNSWRVSPQESLFDYAPGQNTETFTDKSFPKRYRTLSQLSPQQIEQAERVCLEAGVEPDLLDGCIFDVGFTGEAGFAQSAANAMNLINQFNRVIPGGLPIPRLPVRIPGLPF